MESKNKETKDGSNLKEQLRLAIEVKETTEKELQKAINEKNELSTKLEEMVSQKNMVESELNTQNLELRTKLEEIENQNKNSEIKEAYQELKNKFETSKKDNQYLTHELNKATQKVIELTQSLEQYGPNHLNSEELEKENTEDYRIEQLKSQLTNVIADTQKRYDEWQVEKEQLKATINKVEESYEEKLEEKQHEIDTLKDKLSEKEIAELVITKKDIPKAIQDLQELETELEEIQEVQELKKELSKLTKEKEKLQKEKEEFEEEIGEVLAFAKRKAKRTVEEAQLEANKMIRLAEVRVSSIHERAKEILFDVDETKDEVTNLFEDLQFKVKQLAHNKLQFNDFEEYK